MIKAILFDFDDTLVKTIETKINALQYTGKKYYNLDLTDRDIKKHWGKPFRSLMKAVFKNVDRTEKIIEKYTIERKKFPSPPHDNAVKVLRELSKKYLLGIVTSHTKRFIIKDLKIADIPKDLFFLIQTEEETSAHKPDPKVFDLTIKRLKKRGILKSSIVYIGDSLLDFFAARDAGIRFYGLAGRTTTKKQFKQVGSKTIKNLFELIDILKKQN